MRFVKALPVIIAALFVSACGFQPLNTAPDERTVSLHERGIVVSTIPERLGQKLKNALLAHLAPRSRDQKMRYTLTLGVQRSLSSFARRTDETATRATMTLNASLVLGVQGGSEALVRDSVEAIVSYDIVDSEFAALSAEKHAEDRAIKLLEKQIVQRLALYFKTL